MYSWLSVATLTGRVLAELPDFDCAQVSKQIGAGTTASGNLPLTDDTPPEWPRAILEGGAALVLVDEDSGIPVWGGMIVHTNPDHTDKVPISLATYETGYLSRRFVGDVDYDQTGAVDIAIDLLQRFVLTGSNGGIPMRIVVEGASRGVVTDQSYQDTSDKTVLSALQALSALDGGPEWTINWETLDSGQTYTPVFRISGTSLGTRVAAGHSASATFEIPGPVSSVSLDRDYTDGNGANDIMATSTASGASRPQSDHVVVPDPNRPTFEDRFTPDTGIDDLDDKLDSYARARAAQIAGGTLTLALTAAVENAPKLGVDWSEGDDIGYVVGGLDRFDRDLVRAFPGGISGVVRTAGWVLDLSGLEQVTPVLEGPDA
ncbi:hypothetical protein J2X60_003023 [Curtobacterium sp. 320]|uniref:hypothetical protein n=1 Tax=Curtobacterium sp. 320 TaxID=2817749 RepID=UPI00285EB36F|nr:hypothetical protein [Curtobacterium sp. 320]MDR6574364.1 hypothetical protein [Curtobacterium sp. 320]